MSGYSREYAALVNCAIDLEDRLILDKLFIGDLNKAGLISERISEYILSPRSMLTERGKVREMISAIRGAVERNPTNFNKFLDTLKQYTECEGLLKHEFERLGLKESEFL